MNKSIIFSALSCFLFLFSCHSIFDTKVKHLDTYIDEIFKQDLQIFSATDQSAKKLDAEQDQNQLWKDYWGKRDQIKLDPKRDQISLFVDYWLEITLFLFLVLFITLAFFLRQRFKKQNIDDTDLVFEGIVEDNFKKETYSRPNTNSQSVEESKQALMQDFGLSSENLTSQDDFSNSFEEEDDIDSQIVEQLSLQRNSTNQLNQQVETSQSEKKSQIQPQEAIPNAKDSLDWGDYQKEEQIKIEVIRLDKKGYTPSQISQLLKTDLKQIQELLLFQKRNRKS